MMLHRQDLVLYKHSGAIQAWCLGFALLNNDGFSTIPQAFRLMDDIELVVGASW